MRCPRCVEADRVSENDESGWAANDQRADLLMPSGAAVAWPRARRQRAVAVVIALGGACVGLALLLFLLPARESGPQSTTEPGAAEALGHPLLDSAAVDDQVDYPEEIPEEDGDETAPPEPEVTRVRRPVQLDPEEIAIHYESQGEAWVHPLPDASELIPVRSTRLFGAARPGDRPAECGAGHCGLDYGGPRGTPVLSIKDGVVERIVQNPNRRSGKYVKIRHGDGGSSLYMHLDSILGGLMRGDSVQAGDMIGTLGMTGINRGPAHLHFAYKIRNKRGSEKFIDPAPILAESRVVALLDIGLPDFPERSTTASVVTPDLGIAASTYQ